MYAGLSGFMSIYTHLFFTCKVLYQNLSIHLRTLVNIIKEWDSIFSCNCDLRYVSRCTSHANLQVNAIDLKINISCIVRLLVYFEMLTCVCCPSNRCYVFTEQRSWLCNVRTQVCEITERNWRHEYPHGGLLLSD